MPVTLKLVSWSSHQQPTVVSAPVEAENMTAPAVKEALWLTKLLHELQLPAGSIDILCDNQLALKLLKNLAASDCSKHIDMHYPLA
ncbi:hypothetical protein QJQ45_002331 [Haematococcus lacustris]|nr:hypothetical protein QJQ45_002331 [Haematococcus lacustris]